MKITVVVVNWNGGRYIAKCLTALGHLHLPSGIELETIVVDNASTDNSVSVINKFSSFKLIKNPDNLGYTEGNNVGIRQALASRSDFIWIVNPDIEVSPDSLTALVKAAGIYPQTGIFGSKIYFAPGYEFHKDRYTKKDLGKVIWYVGGLNDWNNIQGVHPGVDEVDHGQFQDDRVTDFITGASMFVRRQVFEEIGLFDPGYFLYYEENDFCRRAERKGFNLMVIPKSVAWHANAQATGVGSPLQDYYITRNRLLFGLRYAPLKMKILLIRQSLKLLFTGRPWQKKGVWDFYTGNMGRGSFVPGKPL